MLEKDDIPSFERSVVIKNGRFFELGDILQKMKITKELSEENADITFFQMFGKGLALKIYKSRAYIPVGCLAYIKKGETDYYIRNIESVGNIANSAISTAESIRKFQIFALQGERDVFTYWVRTE